MTLREKLDRYFEERTEAFCEDLAAMVRINSVASRPVPGCPYGEGPAKALEQALEMASGMGFRPVNDENYIGIIDLGPQEPGLDILAHLDVVPPSDGWTVTQPFVPFRDGDRIYGRGTSDDKGPALAALYAMKAIKDLGIPLKKRVRLLLGTDEETGGTDLDHYYAREKEAPMSFSPDGDYPVINIEKGIYHETFSRTFEENALIPRILGAQAGFVINGVPEKATFEIEGLPRESLENCLRKNAEKTGTQYTVEETELGFFVTVIGKSAHASKPETGNNALTAMLELFADLPLSPGIGHNMLRTLHRFFPHGDWEGEALGVKMSDELSGALTLTADLFTYTPTSVSVSVDSRVPLCGNTANMQSVLARTFADSHFEMTGAPMKAPHHVDGDTEFVRTLLRCYEEVSGKKGYCIAIGGGTYVHRLKHGVAFGCAVPEVDNHMHGADEFVLLSQMIMSAKIFALAIAQLCG